jgi:serine/threonine protein kinase
MLLESGLAASSVDMPSSRPHDWIGQTLADRYHVTEKLGAGGMGTVFKAADTRLDAEVVVKAPHPVIIKDAEFAARFKREIQSLVKLSHPNIVKVMDVGEHDGLPFAVMQYLGGGSLEDRSGPCTPEEVAAWLPDAAAALDFMHSEGLIHRDIKPGNILFDFSGRAYLGDFGIAKVVVEGEESDEKLTGTGALIGTAEYMAPEMLVPSAFKEAYNARADQYSLAVTVYEMLAGRPPFRGNSMGDVIAQLVAKTATTLQERNPAIPEDVSRVVARALRKKPGKRFESCQEFSNSFVSAVGGEPSSSVAAASSQPRHSRASRKTPRRATQVEAPGSPATPRTQTIREASPTPRHRRTMAERIESPELSGTRSDRGETVREPPAGEVASSYTESLASRKTELGRKVDTEAAPHMAFFWLGVLSLLCVWPLGIVVVISANRKIARLAQSGAKPDEHLVMGRNCAIIGCVFMLIGLARALYSMFG